jgi:serine/threonine protein kinase
MVMDTRFEVEKKYDIIDLIGYGAYGIVVAAKDKDVPEAKEGGESNLVAIKKIVKAFDHRVFSLRTYRELKIQRLLEHENVLGIKRILKPKNRECFNELYVVSELMETDLAQIIKSNQPLSDDHIQFFLYQILRGLKYVHSAGIYHRDLKPRNLLVNSNCDLKICDFGLARADIPALQTQQTALTDYIATRWYRAPEVILSWRKYTAAIDVWSVGCILAELIIRKPLLPATSEEEQLNMITKLLGNPSPKLVN